ncbi:MAG: RNA methyltransferase [Acidimicrobiia bacterium]|nr:RNA methyltransferase [Acidimicrobiia bacterium]
MVEVITDPADPRIADFVGLTDVELRRRTEAERGCFIIEGPLAIERLVESTYVPRAFLFTPRLYERLGPLAEATGTSVYVADEPVLAATVGFDLHRGAVASAERPKPIDADDLASTARSVLVVEGVNDHENLGSLFRNAAAFGVDAVLLDPTCADPLYRRCVRVSMGHVMRIPFAVAHEWPRSDLDHTVVALTPADGATPIADVPAPDRLALLVGAEGPGLSDAALDAADVRVRIPMAPGADSLNVATAAAVALHHFLSP